MKVLITGAGGFVGRHLASELSAAGMDLVLLSDSNGSVPLPSGQTLPLIHCDIRDRKSVGSIVNEASPDWIVHLAAVSNVVNAQNARELLSEVNIVGTHNVCSSAMGLNKKVKFLFVSTSLVYGSNSKAESQNNSNEVSYDESTLPAPESAYGASKLAGEYIVRSFANEHFVPYIARPFNHIGPGQHTSFVCPSLALKIATTPDGGTIKVGNLKTYRDFTDVRDVVKAYRLIIEKAPKEDLFVLGSGKVIRIDDILSSLIKISGKKIATEVDSALLRDVDPPRLCADPSKSKNILGWECEYLIQDTLKDVYSEALSKSPL